MRLRLSSRNAPRRVAFSREKEPSSFEPAGALASNLRVSRARSIAALALLASALAGCQPGDRGGAGAKGRKPLAFPVQTAQVEARKVEYSIEAVGSLAAFEQVQVTARVAGAVERVRFAEGDRVEKGATLVEIEPERYRVAVASAAAALERARAAEAEVRALLERREALEAKTPGLVKAEELESYRTKARAAAAETALATSALELAEINLRDALVRAPIAGVIQTRTVQTGQYLQPGAVLASLVRRDPLLLRFELPETEASQVVPGMKAWFAIGGEKKSALITHVAEAADPTSRMVGVVARVDGADDPALRPGAFTEVKVPIGDAREAPVIPQMAVRPSEKGFLGYVVEEGKARERVLELGLRTADGLVEIRHGLNIGESLVVRGAEPLSDGVPVVIDSLDEKGAGKAKP